jgi:hypothetical protein
MEATTSAKRARSEDTTADAISECCPKAALIFGPDGIEQYWLCVAWLYGAIRDSTTFATNLATVLELENWATQRLDMLQTKTLSAPTGATREEKQWYEAVGVAWGDANEAFEAAWGGVSLDTQHAAKGRAAKAMLLRRESVLAATGVYGPCTLAKANATSDTPLDYTDDATVLVYKS